MTKKVNSNKKDVKTSWAIDKESRAWKRYEYLINEMQTIQKQRNALMQQLEYVNNQLVEFSGRQKERMDDVLFDSGVPEGTKVSFTGEEFVAEDVE